MTEEKGRFKPIDASKDNPSIRQLIMSDYVIKFNSGKFEMYYVGWSTEELTWKWAKKLGKLVLPMQTLTKALCESSGIDEYDAWTMTINELLELAKEKTQEVIVTNAKKEEEKVFKNDFEDCFG
jgi:hypothetical protein